MRRLASPIPAINKPFCGRSWIGPSVIETPEAFTMFRDLLRLRRDDPTFSAQHADRMYGIVLGGGSVRAAVFERHG